GHDGTALAVHFTAELGDVDALGDGEGVADAVGEEVSLLRGHFNAGQDDETGGGGTQLFQFRLGPEPVGLGDDDAVEADFTGPAEHDEWVHDAVRRVPAGVHVQVKLHGAGPFCAGIGLLMGLSYEDRTPGARKGFTAAGSLDKSPEGAA